MKLRMAVVAALCIGLVCGIAATGYAQAAKVTVYNPMGTPPPIQMKSMAPRLNTLDGKTVFLVSTGFPNSNEFMQVMAEWFKDNHPKTTVVNRRMGMSNMPADLKAEIKEKADAVFFGLGH
jgi:hypothetical protein